MKKVKVLKNFRRGRDYLETDKELELPDMEARTLADAELVKIPEPEKPKKSKK